MPDPDALPGPARLSRLPSTAVSIRHTVLRTLAHTNWRLALPALALTCGSLIVQAASDDPEVVVPTTAPTSAAIGPTGVSSAATRLMGASRLAKSSCAILAAISAPNPQVSWSS